MIDVFIVKLDVFNKCISVWTLWLYKDKKSLRAPFSIQWFFRICNRINRLLIDLKSHRHPSNLFKSAVDHDGVGNKAVFHPSTISLR